MRTHYDSLHVTEDAPHEVIRASYRALSLKYHPDKSDGKRHTLHKMQTLNEAYAILSDKRKREEYDGDLRRQRHPPPSVPHTTAPPVWHDVRVRHARPAWLKASLLYCSDARVVLPIVVLIWWVVFRLISRTA